jgi:5'-nucleotidase
MSPLFRRAALAAAAAALLLPSGASAAHKPKQHKDDHVQVLAVNDFHGNLEPPTGSSGQTRLADGTAVDSGGAAYMATHVKQLEAGQKHSIFVGAGDLIGASPLASALFHDEPTVEAFNLMGLDASAVGNHEFDEGVDELLRIQNGGCHPVDGCQFHDPYQGAAFQYLAGNVLSENSGLPVLPPYLVRKFGKSKVAFIGLVLKGTPTIVTPSGVAGLDFLPEAATANALVKRLRKKRHIRSFVIAIHEGGRQTAYAGPDGCGGFTGDIGPIVDALDPEIDVVLSAHTHEAYICRRNGMLLTSASSFGRLITDVDLVIDRKTHDVTSSTARNVVVTRTVTPDPAVQALVDEAKAKSAPIANRTVGTITADVLRAQNPAGESALGDVIADSQLAATAGNGAQIAFMNPGGIRADLTYASSPTGEGAGVVTYGEAFTVQPFSNTLATKTMTGAQIKRVLEQQFVGFEGQTTQRILQVSAGLTYSWSASAPAGAKVSGIQLNGVALDPAATYRVTMNSFLATGGDGFAVFNEGTEQVGGDVDLDAFTAYLTAHPGLAPPAGGRITVAG